MVEKEEENKEPGPLNVSAKSPYMNKAGVVLLICKSNVQQIAIQLLSYKHNELIALLKWHLH